MYKRIAKFEGSIKDYFDSLSVEERQTIFEDYVVLVHKTTEKWLTDKIAFIKHLMLIGSGSFGIIISLRQDNETSAYGDYSFFASMLILALALILGAFTLNGYLTVLKRDLINVRKNLEDYLAEKGNITALPTYKIPKIYSTTEILYYIFLIFVIVGFCLMIYFNTFSI